MMGTAISRLRNRVRFQNSRQKAAAIWMRRVLRAPYRPLYYKHVVRWEKRAKTQRDLILQWPRRGFVSQSGKIPRAGELAPLRGVHRLRPASFLRSSHYGFVTRIKRRLDYPAQYKHGGCKRVSGLSRPIAEMPGKLAVVFPKIF